MAATSHPLATLTALDVLRRGGNAVDAAVAAMALLGVVEPTQTGIGGDCFALLMRRGEGEVIALNGSGWAPAGATLDRYAASASPRSRGERPRGYGSRRCRVLGAARRRSRHHGVSRRCLQPAIEAAEHGYPGHRTRRARLGEAGRRNCGAMRPQRRSSCSDGRPPRPGAVHRQPALAAALRSIAEDGPTAFYQGWIARDMVETLRGLGGCHTIDDFSTYTPEYVTPVHTSYRGFEIWECPPNGQGLVPLAMLNALAGFDAARWTPLAAERVHAVVEIGRQAYADRDCLFGDPRTGAIAWMHFCRTARGANARARVVHPAVNADAPVPLPEHRDTTFVAVVDSERNTVALINSIFDDFGTGIVSPDRALSSITAARLRSGAGPSQRDCGAETAAEHHHPRDADRQGKAVMPFGVTGGHFQPFGQVQIMTNILDYGMECSGRIDAPRFFASAMPSTLT